MNTNQKMLIGLLLFGTWLALVVCKVSGTDDLISAIKYALLGLGVYHLGDNGNTQAATPTAPPTDKQAGFSLLSMLFVLIIGASLLSGCGVLNAYTGAALNSAESGYTGAKQNIKSADDMKFITWADTACALPLGSLARNATGNPFAVNAALTACPIPNVGIVQAKDGQVQVQITQPTPTPPYVAPAPTSQTAASK